MRADNLRGLCSCCWGRVWLVPGTLYILSKPRKPRSESIPGTAHSQFCLLQVESIPCSLQIWGWLSFLRHPLILLSGLNNFSSFNYCSWNPGRLNLLVVVQLLRNPMDCSMPVFHVLHCLLELAQTHVHWVSDAIQPSHPLSSPSPPALNLVQHQ